MLEVNQSNFVIISPMGAVSWYEMKQNIVKNSGQYQAYRTRLYLSTSLPGGSVEATYKQI